MGLDISYYSKVKFIRKNDDNDCEDNEVHLWVNTDWPERADGLTDGIYSFDTEDGFRAGSYDGYNTWREQLAALVGTTPEDVWANPQPGPFMELINFADNEGFIGPVTSAKLAKDFVEYNSKAQWLKVDNSDFGWFYMKYSEWHSAFNLASDAGVVKFH